MNTRLWNGIRSERVKLRERLTHHWEIYDTRYDRVYKCNNCGVYGSVHKGKVHWSKDEFLRHEEVVDNEIQMPTCKEFEMMDALE